VWTSPRYCWTPGGFVFIAGHWDHDLHHRGYCYSPVYIDPRLYARGGWNYRPHYVIQPDFLIGSLFINLHTHHYYFGDFYEAGYARRGYQPWIDFRVHRTAYDPLYGYYRWQHRDQPRWDADVKAVYVDRRDNAKSRPPRTLAAQQTTNVSVVVAPAQVKNTPFKVTQVTKAQVTEIQKVSEEWRNVSKQRGKSEAAVKVNKQPGAAPIKLDLPKTPVKIVRPQKAPPPEPDRPKVHEVKDKGKIDGPKDKGPKDKGPKIDPPPKDKGPKIDPPPKDKGPKVDPPPKDKGPKVDPPPKDKGPKVDPPPKDKGPKVDPPPKDKGPKVDPPPKDKKGKDKGDGTLSSRTVHDDSQWPTICVLSPVGSHCPQCIPMFFSGSAWREWERLVFLL
jgi:hypothetical protein